MHSTLQNSDRDCKITAATTMTKIAVTMMVSTVMTALDMVYVELGFD